jgi:hypothetical protein
VTVLRTESAESFPAVLAPGEGAVVRGLPIVRTGDGAVVLREALIHGDPDDPAGGLDRLASAEDLAALFLSRFRLMIG